MIMKQMWGAATGHPSRHPYPEHMARAREIAADGMVLLKNNGALPLQPGKLAVFGAGAVDTVACGTGSGMVFAPYIVSVRQGLKNAGFEITSEGWLKRFAAADKLANKKDKTLSVLDKRFSGVKIMIDDLPVTPAELEQARAADTCVYVIRRNAGENHDRKAGKGDYYLTDAERGNLELLAKSFRHTVVVMNTCVIDTNFADEILGVDALVMMGPAGNECGNALADILTGKVTPSGKLTDTWANRYSDYPASAVFSLNDDDAHQETYSEDIFVGYRYFDTFGIVPRYPFGFGLSYTTFALETAAVSADWNEVRVTVTVTNTGSMAGREVVQLYVTAPEGKLPKPYQELKAFGKTHLLQPGETETLTICAPTESLASYDPARAAFVMEAGDYILRVGNSSRDTAPAAAIRLDADAVVRTVNNELTPDRTVITPTPPARAAEKIPTLICMLCAKECKTVDGRCHLPEQGAFVNKHPDATFCDVRDGRVTVEEFVASLDTEVLLRLVTGNGYESKYSVPSRMKTKFKNPAAPGSSGATTGLFDSSLGIPQCNMTDGPAGLHMMGCGATCNPSGIVLAQTWDTACAETVGTGIGKELEYYNHHIILGPGMNIHRDPLGGRNFEYFSEDPLITGKMGAAYTIGVQRTPTSTVAIKHFAANESEEDRITGNSTVSERALREIYLRGFEICVREAAPKTVMSSYNHLNGTHTSSSYELLTEVLRGEWGFDGLVMTDWGSQSDKALDFAAGNDLIMGGYRTKLLSAAIRGDAPEFGADGFVKEEVFAVYGGFFKERIQLWNCFQPDAAGKDTVSVVAAPGLKLNKQIDDYISRGIANIETLPDGSCRVTYRGTNRGAYLALADVRKCAANVIRLLLRVCK